MSIWDAFGKGRYKGFSREAGQLLDKAVELAGGLGCKKADTGHLLWAMLQSDGGPAARFLAGNPMSAAECGHFCLTEQINALRRNFGVRFTEMFCSPYYRLKNALAIHRRKHCARE